MGVNLCALCKEKIELHEYELPGGDGVFVGINPETLRIATMHESCSKVAWEDSEFMPSTDNRFGSRQEQALEKSQGGE